MLAIIVWKWRRKKESCRLLGECLLGGENGGKEKGKGMIILWFFLVLEILVLLQILFRVLIKLC